MVLIFRDIEVGPKEFKEVNVFVVVNPGEFFLGERFFYECKDTELFFCEIVAFEVLDSVIV